MRKIIFISVCFFAFKGQAQDFRSSFGLNAGASEDGLGVLLDYNYYISRFNNNSLNIGAFMSLANYSYDGQDIPYVFYSLQAGYTQQIYQNFNENLRLGLLGGLITGYESINNGDHLIGEGVDIEGDSKVIFGLYLGGEMDFMIGRKMSLVLRMHESYHVNSDMGNFTPYIGVGIRLYNQ